jgi:hypothetical protein
VEVVTGAGGGGAGLVIAGAGLAVVGTPPVVVRVTVVAELAAPVDCDAAAAALLRAACADAASAAAVALVLWAVDLSPATRLRSLASVALKVASTWALCAAWRDAYAGTVEVVVVVTAGRVEPTKELARPAPTIATDVTTTVGSTRRRALERSSVREVRARLAARR